MEPYTNQPPPSFPDLLQRADDYARREPAKAVLSAFALSFLFNLLPLGAIAGALARIAFSFLRPVLFFLGLVKVYECCRSQALAKQNHE